MKKTVSVNIKGSNFLIEEDAYELLQDYLDRLTKALKNESGSKEIIEDVELRIAELCSEKLREYRTVVELEDIQDILNTLGDPAMYLGDEDDDTDGQSQTYDKPNDATTERRLFRDTDNAVIAGVCQGIANFFSIDVVVVRAIFVVILLFAGFGFPLYVILWIIVPKAKSTIDRLRMKGRAITVESLREEVENAADRIKDKGSNFASSLRENEHYKGRFHRIGRIISVIVGLGFICWGLTWLIMFLIFIIGGFQFIPIISEDGFISITELGELVLASPDDTWLAWFGGLMGGFGIILFLLLLGTRILLKLKNKWMNLSLGGLFTLALTGGIICAYIGLRAAADVTIEREGENKELTVSTNVLTLLPQVHSVHTPNGMKVKSDGRNAFMKITQDKIRMYGIEMIYRESDDSLFHIYQNFSARGRSNGIAVSRADNIEHSIQLKGDSLYIDTDYKFPRNDKIRDQKVVIVIEIPVNAKIVADGRTIRFGDLDEEDEDEDDYDSNSRRRKYGTFFGDGYYESHRNNY